MPKYGSYGSGTLAGETPPELKRAPAKRVSYDNTRREPRSKAPSGSKFAHVKPIPKATP